MNVQIRGEKTFTYGDADYLGVFVQNADGTLQITAQPTVTGYTSAGVVADINEEDATAYDNTVAAIGVALNTQFFVDTVAMNLFPGNYLIVFTIPFTRQGAEQSTRLLGIILIVEPVP